MGRERCPFYRKERQKRDIPPEEKIFETECSGHSLRHSMLCLSMCSYRSPYCAIVFVLHAAAGGGGYCLV